MSAVASERFALVRPTAEYLPGYVDALHRGWSSDNVLGAVAAQEELCQIQTSSAEFLDSLEDRDAKGAPVVLPDGTSFPRLPGYKRWIWDGEFCGSIGFRWQRGTSELPPQVLGHIGYAVVPWKRCRGYATRALGLLLPFAREEGLTYVDLTTDPDNIESQKVITANAGRLIERFIEPLQYGGEEALRFRVTL